MPYVLHVINLAAIYALLVLGLQFSVGRGRVMFVAPTVFFAIGAYGSALLSTRAEWNALTAAAASAAGAGVTGYFLGLLALRLAGDHLLLASLGLCEITRSVANNWHPVTNGSIGVMDIPPIIPRPLAAHVGGPIEAACLLSVLVVVACLLFSWRMGASSFGDVHASLHGDPHGSAAIGRRVNRTKRLAIAWGGLWMAVAGSLFAHSAHYIDPTTFTVGEAMTVFAMLVVGGMGRPSGAVLGAAVFIVLPELLRFVGVPGQVADPLRRGAYGILLLGTVLFLPEGFASALTSRRPADATTRVNGGTNALR